MIFRFYTNGPDVRAVFAELQLESLLPPPVANPVTPAARAVRMVAGPAPQAMTDTATGCEGDDEPPVETVSDALTRRLAALRTP